MKNLPGYTIMNTYNNKEKLMRKDRVLPLLKQIDFRLAELARSHHEDEVVAIQREIIRSLDSCIYYLEQEEKTIAFYTCAHCFGIIKQIDRDINDDQRHDRTINNNIYEMQKTRIIRDVQLIKSKILPLALKQAA